MQQQQQQQQQNKLETNSLFCNFSQFCIENFKLNITNIIEKTASIMQEKNENWQADIKNLYNQSFNEQNIKNYFDKFNILSKNIDQQHRDFDICLIDPFLNNNNNNNNINNSECSIIALSDIHSDLESIKTIYNFLTKNTENGNNYLIFNGDYTNRDLEETENIPSIIMFFTTTALGLYSKIYPDKSKIVLNLGNHETASIIGPWAEKLLIDSNKNISQEQIFDSQLFENEDNNILSKFKLQIAEMYNKSMFLEIIFRDEIIFKHSAGIDMYQILQNLNENKNINIIPIKIITYNKKLDQTQSTASIESENINDNNSNNNLSIKKKQRFSLDLKPENNKIVQIKKYSYDQKQHQNEEDENDNNNTKVNQIEINSMQSNTNRRDNKYKFYKYGTHGMWADPFNKNFFSEYFARDGINLNDKKKTSDLFDKLYSQFYKTKIPIIKIVGHSNGNINEFYNQKTNSIKSKIITENQSSFFDQIQINNNNNNSLLITLPAFYNHNTLQKKNILENNAQNTTLQIILFSNNNIILNNIKLP
jgi:hypothetical protein